MAEKPISTSDLIDVAGIDKIIQSFKNLESNTVASLANIKKAQTELTSNLKLLQEQIRKNIESTNSLTGSSDKNEEQLKKNITNLSTLTQTYKKNSEQVAVLNDKEKQLLIQQKAQQTLTSKLNSLNGDAAKKNAELKVAITAKNQALKQEALESVGLLSLYQKKSKHLNDLRNKYKDLVLAEQQNTKEARNLKNQIDKLDSTLKKVDADVGQFQRNVGNYGKAWNSVGKLMRSAFLLGGFAGVGAVIKGAVKTIATFEAAVSSLSSITGATGKDLQFYREEAIKMGASTTLSATQAITAFKLIGSAKPELLKNKEALASVTQEAVALAEAAEIELPVAAQALAGSLNQFGASAKEASRFINAFAAGSKEGAAAIPEISQSIDKFGPSAKAFNVNIEESIGLVETLAESNIKGAEAGTALRNVLNAMAAAEVLPPAAKAQLEAFGVDISVISDKTIPLNERLREFSKISEDAGALTKVFGKENQVAGQIILQNVDKFEKYTKAVTGTSTAYEQQATNVDNLKGDVKGLASAYEGLLLNIESGDGILNKIFRGSVQGITALINGITGVKKSFLEVNQVTFENSKASAQAAMSAQTLLDEYESLTTDGLEPTAEEKQRLEIITYQLRDAFGESVVQIDKETGALILNTEAVREQIKLKRLAADNEAATLVSRLKGVQEEIKSIDFMTKTLEREREAREREAQRVLGTIDLEWLKEVEFNKSGSIVNKLRGLTDEQREAVERLGAVEDRIKLQQREKLTQQEREADLIAKLKELNFTAADAEAFFAESLDTSTKATEGNTKATQDNNKSKKDAEQIAKRIAKATFELNKFRIEQEIKVLEETANNENSSLLERLASLELITQKRIQLAEMEKDFKISTEKDMLASERALLDEQNRAIVSDAETAGQARIDALFIDAEKATSGQDFKSIIDSDLKDKLNSIDTAKNAELIALEERALNTKDKEQAIFDIEEEFRRKSLLATLAFLKNKRDIFAETDSEKIELTKQISDIELELLRKDGDKKIDITQDVQDQLKQLEQTLLDFQVARFERNLERLDLQEDRLKESLDTELNLAGDNEEAKAQIEQEFADKQKRIDDERIRLKRKQANFEKLQSIVSITVDTAKGIGAQLPGLPYTAGLIALIAAMGAAQIAIVAGQQVPAYKDGTDSAEGGISKVGELGTELIYDPKKDEAFLTPNKTSFMDVPEGAIVFDAVTTRRMRSNSNNKDLIDVNSDNKSLGISHNKTKNAEYRYQASMRAPVQSKIDYNRLGKAVAKNIPPAQITEFQKDGTVKFFTQHKDGSRIENLNKKSSLIHREHPLNLSLTKVEAQIKKLNKRVK